MRIIGIIPARYESTRFPGKPLVDISGKTMIRRVYEACQKFDQFDSLIVATDDERIKLEVESFGGKVVMTNPDLPSGTDRCAEVIKQLDQQFDAVINIQGDEPLTSIEQLEIVTQSLQKGNSIVTLKKKIEDKNAILSPNIVKVVTTIHNEALYFSRNCIPFLRDTPLDQWIHQHSFFKHIGLYAYHTNTLLEITNLSQTPLEKNESLEQLRWLENGYKISVEETFTQSAAIDTPSDLNNFLLKFKNKLD